MNSEYIAEREEKKAPGITQRIIAASRVQEAGYKLAFHFDPIIFYEGWEKGYKDTVDRIFEKIRPENIVYISMGSLRFSPEIESYIENMGKYYSQGEFIKGSDKKMRYFRPLRTRMYRTLKSYLQTYVDENIVYLCMETPTVWEDVFGIPHMNSKNLIQRLDNACIDKFGLHRK